MRPSISVLVITRLRCVHCSSVALEAYRFFWSNGSDHTFKPTGPTRYEMKGQ